MTVAPLQAAELRDLALTPYGAERYSPLAEIPYLLAELPAAAEAALAPAQRHHIAAWLRQLPCPTIAIAGADGHSELLRAFDTRVTEHSEAQPLIAAIETTPLAAMTLVQVLRATETLSLEQGLLVESLAYATLQAGPEFQRWSAEPRSAAPRHSDSGPPLRVERVGDTLKLQLNRPSRRNAISVEMRDALVEALQLAVADTSIGGVELSAAGACFSVGGDLDEFGTAPDPANAHAIRSLRLPGRVLAQCAQRVHCRVHSACIGAGAEIPAFAARVTARRNSFFQLPELRFGLIPGAGGCVSIPRRIGRQRAAYMALSGRKINAATALAWGLVDAIED